MAIRRDRDDPDRWELDIDLDPATEAALQARARGNGRTTNAEVLAILDAALGLDDLGITLINPWAA
ncbi:hypothetical protein HQQ81_06320 [Microbacteriaceae bacterium VKM Ac-2854]|nr:hypothetical protein [Microbacteriaceae bacterium VKM Ac-2854]